MELDNHMTMREVHTCSECEGSGMHVDEGDDEVMCQRCDGAGQIEEEG